MIMHCKNQLSGTVHYTQIVAGKKKNKSRITEFYYMFLLIFIFYKILLLIHQ